MVVSSEQEVDALKLAANFGKLCVIPLEHILVHNIALQFFMGELKRMQTNCPVVRDTSSAFSSIQFINLCL